MAIKNLLPECSGLLINGDIVQAKVTIGENINKGDFLTFMNIVGNGISLKQSQILFDSSGDNYNSSICIGTGVKLSNNKYMLAYNKETGNTNLVIIDTSTEPYTYGTIYTISNNSPTGAGIIFYPYLFKINGNIYVRLSYIGGNVVTKIYKINFTDMTITDTTTLFTYNNSQIIYPFTVGNYFVTSGYTNSTNRLLVYNVTTETYIEAQSLYHYNFGNAGCAINNVLFCIMSNDNNTGYHPVINLINSSSPNAIIQSLNIGTELNYVTYNSPGCIYDETDNDIIVITYVTGLGLCYSIVNVDIDNSILTLSKDITAFLVTNNANYVSNVVKMTDYSYLVCVTYSSGPKYYKLTYNKSNLTITATEITNSNLDANSDYNLLSVCEGVIISQYYSSHSGSRDISFKLIDYTDTDLYVKEFNSLTDTLQGGIALQSGIANETIDVAIPYIQHLISTNLDYCTITNLPSYMTSKDVISMTVIPSNNYDLPNTITVTGATAEWSITNNVGTLTLSNAIGDVGIEIIAEFVGYTVRYYQGSTLLASQNIPITNGGQSLMNAEQYASISTSYGWQAYGWKLKSNNTFTKLYDCEETLAIDIGQKGDVIDLNLLQIRDITIYSGIDNSSYDDYSQYQYVDNSNNAILSSITVSSNSVEAISSWTPRGLKNNSSITASITFSFDTDYTVPYNNTGNYNTLYSKQGSITVVKNLSGTVASVQKIGYYNSYGDFLPNTLVYVLPQSLMDTLTDWTKAGWRLDTSAAAPTEATGIEASFSGDTAYAIYNRTLTVSYNGNSSDSGSTSSTTKTVYLNVNSTTTSSQTVLLASNGFTKSGYTFVGWCEDANGNGTIYQPGDNYTPNLAYNSQSFVKELYAIWQSDTPPQENFITFSSPNSFTLGVNDYDQYWDGIIEYSTDKSTWNEWDGVITLNSVSDGTNHNLYLRGSGNTVITGSSAGTSRARWKLYDTSGMHTISCSGNIENLLDYKTVANGQHPTMGVSCFAYLFANNSDLISTPSLPAITLSDSCYRSFAYYCTNLKTINDLPSKTLVYNCYRSMYQGCSSLKIYSTVSYAEYPNRYRIPMDELVNATSLTTSTTSMFSGTLTDISTVNVNQNYYTNATIVMADGTLIPPTFE